ncbi:hypothetical protein B0J13DRAFT_84151 [Dactylonectria estremocensis]|uniref:Zn(2)-C6 fungal-type domain-containing protein n=1 Tax=Dactylonectria estremocensis TaxID=1079267 RepID=A0A9P9ECA1_9HYPO|nr:hypothetical protein B0J13DRAFT_84151 [Dactylonectria estremocensis]
MTDSTTSRRGSRASRLPLNDFITTFTNGKSAACYTCKIRKVRCETIESVPGAEEITSSSAKCANCQRLGFQCGWRSSESGEPYVPPPKRRRTIGQRRQRSSHAIDTDPPSTADRPLLETDANGEDGRQSSSTPQPLIVSLSRPLPATDAPEHQLEESESSGGSQHQSSGVVTSPVTLDLSFDLGFDSQYLDFDLAGEGLGDFLPFPNIDNSFLDLPEAINGSSTSAWQPDNDGPTTAHSDSLPQSLGNPSSVINDDNRHLVQHYLEVIKGYSKVDDRSKESNNLFVSAFAQSLTFPPLLYAILAFSASHLSIKDPVYSGQASEFNRLAEETFQEFKGTHEANITSLLSALFVRIKQVHVMGGSVDILFALIAAVVDIVSTKDGERALADPNSLVRRIILRLALLDARATCFQLGGGQLVKLLRRSPSLSSIFNFNSSNTSTPPYGAAMSLLRADLFRNRVGELDTRLRKQLDAEFVIGAPIRTEEIKSLYDNIQRELDRCHRDIAHSRRDRGLDFVTDEILDSAEYNFYVVSSALHSSLLYLYQVYPLPFFNQSKSISEIFHHQLKIQRDPSHANSPSSILPSSIFLAGLSTSDPIHRDWVLRILKDGETWGLYIRKTRKLLETIFKMQAGGDKVDICYAMDQVTGRFLI